MNAPSRRLEPLRAAWASLGPLRWLVVWAAVVPTLLSWLVLWHLDDLAALVERGRAALVLTLAPLAIAAATGFALLPAGVAALAGGYCLGAPAGASITVLGCGGGAVLAHAVVWPALGEPLYAFVRPRPRIALVKRFCQGPAASLPLRIAQLRSAAKFPFAVQSLLTSAAGLPVRAVFTGALLSAIAPCLSAACAGAALRTVRARGELPFGTLAVAAAAAAVGLVLLRRGRARWRAAAA